MKITAKARLTTLALALIITVGGAAAYATTRHQSPKPASTPTVSVACQTAANRQDAYAQLADAQGYLTTYTNAQQLAANQIDGVLVTDMISAGCPQYVRYFDMTTGEWDN